MAGTYNNYREQEEEGDADGEISEPYEVERIATILAVTFIFLSALYTIFAVLLFLCHAGEEQSILRIEQGTGGVGIGRHVNNIGTSIPSASLTRPNVTNSYAGSKSTPLVGLGVVDGNVDRNYDNGIGMGQIQSMTLGDGARGFITMDNSSQGTLE